MSKIDLQKFSRKAIQRRIRFLEQGRAKVHTQIRATMAALGQLAGEFPVPASQIQYRFIAFQHLEYTAHSWLDPMACGRERFAKTRVKITVDLDQACGSL